MKSSIMWTFSFDDWGALGRGRRERTAMEVMDGLAMLWIRISEPMKPVVPARMSFILVVVSLFCCLVLIFEVEFGG